MNGSKFNFAYVLSIVVLLVFAYITFLGLAYWTGGSLTTPILLTLLLVILVAGCVMIMSMSRSTRWTDIGLIGQICFGVIVFAALMAATIPFTNFLRVVNEKNQMKELMIETANAGAEMDKAYLDYAEKRISNYKIALQGISATKNSNPQGYADAFGQAAGNTDTDKINALSESLRAKLLPMDAKDIVDERHQWLNRAADLNVWNPMTPSNVNTLKDQMFVWTDNYRQLSSTMYNGEKAEVFTYDKFESKLNALVDSYQKFRRPSAIAIVAAVICFVFMLLPYFVAQGSLAAARSGNSNTTMYE